MVTRLGISSDTELAPLYFSKCSPYLLPSTFQGLKICPSSEIHSDIHIYTDGSKSEEGTGAAFCVFRCGSCIHTWRRRLLLGNSVFQAELCAIRAALQWAEASFFPSSQIFTDSQSSVLALDKNQNRDHLVVEIQHLLHETTKSYYFSWVRGHTGIVGNENADTLAKLATTEDNPQTLFLPLPPSHLKFKLKHQLLTLWQQRWDMSTVGTYTKQFLPHVSTNFFISNRAIILFLTNHGPFQEHLFKINRSGSPDCVCGQLSSSLHYVLECTLTSTYHIRKAPSISLNSWLIHILANPPVRRRLIDCMTFLEKNEFIFSTPILLRPR